MPGDDTNAPPSPTPQTHPVVISTPRTSQPTAPQNTVSTVKPECEKQPHWQTLSPTTCLQLVPLLTSEQVRREYAYLTSLNPDISKSVKIKNSRRPTLAEQREVIRETLTQGVAVVHDVLLDNAAQINNILIPNISCMVNKVELQSRHLEDQMTSLTKSLEELKELKISAESPVSKTPLFTTPSTSPNTRDTDSRTTTSPDTCTAADTQEVLILTDSILNCFKPDKFTPRDSTSRMNITKHNLFKLHELDTYDFNKFNTVIISSGINDLTKYNHSPDSLFELISRPLARINRNTKVIFRGLTPTRYNDINQLVYRFNNLMFDFCLTHSNIYYYDPHNFETRRDFLYRQGNGIHISYHVAVFMTMNILNHAQFLYSRNGEFEHWPLRASLQARFERHYPR